MAAHLVALPCVLPGRCLAIAARALVDRAAPLKGATLGRGRGFKHIVGQQLRHMVGVWL